MTKGQKKRNRNRKKKAAAAAGTPNDERTAPAGAETIGSVGPKEGPPSDFVQPPSSCPKA